jgi:hypothetical protein
MPDNSNLQINVTTTADTTGIDQIRQKLNDLGGMTAVPPGLLGLEEPIAAASVQTKALTDQFGLAGASMNKAKGEALVLAREIATGSVNARTLGALLGALGAPITVAAIGAIGIFEAIKRVNDEQNKWTDEVIRTQGEMTKLGETILALDGKMRESALVKGLPLGVALERAQQDLERLKTEQDLVNLSTKEGLEEYEKYQRAIGAAQAVVDSLHKSQQRQTEVVQQTTDQIALNRAYGDEELTIQLKIQQVYDAKLKSLLDARVPEALAKDLATETAESERQKLEAIRGQAAPQNDLLALLREESSLLQGIRQQQQLTQQNPFLSADGKQTLLLQQYVQEMQALNTEISKTKAVIQGGGLDPAQLEQAKQKYQSLVFEANLLGLKVAGIKAPFAAEIVQWANLFGTSIHQAANALTSTLGTAISGVSNAMTGLIFGTQNWRQAMAQTVESIVADLIRIALQFVITRTLMFIVNKAFSSQESGVANAQAQGAFSAWEPAAIAASTASYGVAAGVGLAAFLAAVASGQVAGIALGAAGGAATLHGGGYIRRRRMHSGGLAPDEVPIIAQENEFMVQRSVVQQPGVLEFLTALNAGMLFHSGGWIRRLHKGGDDFDPATWADPMPVGPIWVPSDIWGPDWTDGLGDHTGSGPTVETPTDRSDSGAWARNELGIDNTMAARMLTGFGLNPSFGPSLFGPTMDPTFWVNYPGVGNVPMAVPLGGWNDPSGTGTSQQFHAGFQFKPKHSGGAIGSRFHSGGSIGSIPSFGRINVGRSIGSLPSVRRFHTGGSLGSSAGGSGSAHSQQIHIHNYTDLKTLVKEMAGRQGRNIIIDTVRGHRIDLGI